MNCFFPKKHVAGLALIGPLLLGLGCGDSTSTSSTPSTDGSGQSITEPTPEQPSEPTNTSSVTASVPRAAQSARTTNASTIVVPPLLPKVPPNIVILPPPSRLRQNPAIMRDTKYQALIASVFDQPYRQIGTNVFDFRPLKYAIQNGAAVIENEFGMWRVLLFQVQDLATNGALVQLDRTYHGAKAPRVFVHNLQENHLGLTPASQLATLAMETNSFALNIGGTQQTVSAYEAGAKPDAAIVETVNELAAQQAASRLAAAKEAQGNRDAGKKMLADERRLNAERRKLSFLKERALDGSASFQYRLALLHLTGAGVEKDLVEAKRLLRLSAGQGYNQAVRKLADLDK
jgi:hypothetical protein